MKKVWVNKAYSFQEAEDFDIQFWQKAGALARFAATWMMVVQYQKIKGRKSGQPRLRRTVQHIERT
ncbi:MAG: hypothetical protein NC930_02680 [Candidatus Omnitrophica bacterium]|nr:hypothetical protein [Candidatus Omnitrophota bacterium]